MGRGIAYTTPSGQEAVVCAPALAANALNTTRTVFMFAMCLLCWAFQLELEDVQLACVEVTDGEDSEVGRTHIQHTGRREMALHDRHLPQHHETYNLGIGKAPRSGIGRNCQPPSRR